MPLFTKSEKQGLWPLATKGPDEENCIEYVQSALQLATFYLVLTTFSKSSAEVDDFARDFLYRINSVRNSNTEQTRRVVFICHSLGGLLFKQALVLCNNGQNYRHLLERIHGIVFMGTPHRGSDIAFWASYAGNLINAVSFGTRTNKDLLGVLRKDSSFLGSLSQKFVLQSRFMHILSFYETERFPMLNCRIVEKGSAHLSVSNEILLPIKADHRTMCHFSDPASQKWISFSSAVMNLARANTETTATLDPRLPRHREEMNKWLDPLPMVDDYNRIRDLRLANTCQWINQEPKFLAWRSSSCRNAALWLRGPPGCGKSTLAASIIDQLSADQPTAYFFCNVEDPDRSNFTRVLKTLTWQLVLKKPHLADGIYDIYLETAGAATPIESYKRALARILKDGEPCYVVIDGLDECHGKHCDISKAMFHISSHAKLLVVSRWVTWIEQCFPLGSMTSTLDIVTTHTSRDISLFVDSKTQELDLDPELVDKLSILLIAKANGMFLWVKLTIEYLSQQATLEDTIEALKDLPKDLEALYERLVRRLQELPQSRYELACKLIQWTFSSLRPLSLEQLKIALSITPGDNRKKYPNNVLNLEKFVRKSCSPLLELDEAKGTVRFVHASAVDFFSRSTRPASHFKFMESEQLTFIPKVTTPYCASVCLPYLSIEDIEFVPEDRDPRVYNRNLDKHLARYPFLQYCVLNWWKHLSLPQSGPDPTTEALGNAIQSFTSSQNVLCGGCNCFNFLMDFMKKKAPKQLSSDLQNRHMPGDSLTRILSSIISGLPRVVCSPAGNAGEQRSLLMETIRRRLELLHSSTSSML
ncbi:hypothetical protein F5882DRAFT_439845 [Hyaloscypha sp. PMI_1271]|nr:hypothetical protein F5882DRAFT_439845 [Hyaloscypha sp. PMI_1271]